MSYPIKQVVRQLRKNLTVPEKILWDRLRNRRICGKKFVRQYPIIFNYFGNQRFLTADFYCHQIKSAIEIDGSIHERRKEYDNNREKAMKALGIKILRFSNKEILENILEVLKKIELAISC
jgi:very-short-patch-repair endonuclease